MQIVTLPNGRVLQAIEIDKVPVSSHFPIGSKSGKFYVQIVLKNGDVEDVAERLSEPDALEIQRQLLREVKAAYHEVAPYEAGRADGWQTGFSAGKDEGYEKGRNEGYSAGHSAGGLTEQSQIRTKLLERQHSYRRELTDSVSLGTARRRFLNNAVRLLDELLNETIRE